MFDILCTYKHARKNHTYRFIHIDTLERSLLFLAWLFIIVRVISLFPLYVRTILFYFFKIIPAIAFGDQFFASLILIYKDSQFSEFSNLFFGNRFFLFLLICVNSNYISINITNLTHTFFISKNIAIKMKLVCVVST